MGDQEGEELLAVSASLQLFHFANVPTAAVEVSLKQNVEERVRAEGGTSCMPTLGVIIVFTWEKALR